MLLLKQFMKGKQVIFHSHLRDSHYAGAIALGHVGYKYPHDSPIGTFGGWVNQQYLPDNLVGQEFYKPVICW